MDICFPFSTDLAGKSDGSSHSGSQNAGILAGGGVGDQTSMAHRKLQVCVGVDCGQATGKHLESSLKSIK